MNVPLFKIRASACADIMTNDKSGKGMGKTAQTYCEMWLKEKLYNRQKEFTSKYTEKGNICEDNSLDFIADYLGYGMLVKNDRHIENDYMTGTPDVILNDLIIDAKNPYDCFTFPTFATTLPNKDYDWQMQVYMILADKPAAKVIYTLSNTPENIIQREAFYYCRNNDIEMEQDVIDEFIAKMTYPDIPDRYKIKVFDVPRRPEAEAEIVNRVKQCREYIETLIKGLK